MRPLATIPAVIIIAIALCSGCAARAAKPSACDPVPEEFALAGQPVYRDCNVDRAARPSNTVRPSYTPLGNQTCARVTIDVVVDSAGLPVSETARVVRSTDPGLGLAVLKSLGEMRYAPALKDSRPVSQLVRVDYVVARVAAPAGTPASSVRPQPRPPC